MKNKKIFDLLELQNCILLQNFYLNNQLWIEIQKLNT